MQEQGQPAAPTPALLDRYLPEQDGGAHAATGMANLLSKEMLRAMIWRQRFVLLGVTALVVLAGLIFTLLATPTYKATATVRINTDYSQIIEGQELVDPYINPNLILSYLTTLTEVLQSRNMALRVADSLDLPSNEAFAGPDEQLAGISAAQSAENRRQAAANMLRGGVETEVLTNTQIIAISFSSSDAELAAQIANSYAENFLTDDINQAIDANAYAREYLQEQINDARAKLREAEIEAIEYARANRIIAEPAASTGGETATGVAPTLTASNLAQVNEAYTLARARRIEAEQRWSAVANVPAAQLPEVRQSSAVQSMRTQLALRRSELSDLRERYREDYPAVRSAASEIATLSQQIDAVSAEIKAGIRNEFEVARNQERGLQRELSQVSDASLNEQDRRVQYNIIDREVDSMRAQLATLMDRYNQISAAANLRSSNYAMLDPAVVPQAPSSPILSRNLFIALILGLGLAAALAVLRELLDDRLRTIEDVEQRLGLPTLGQTPYVPDTVGNDIDDRFSPISEAYASIRASLDYRLDSNAGVVIQFTSSQATEGKTTSSVALAHKYAEVGRKVLLVDLDLRRPSVHTMFDQSRSQSGGVVDVIFNRLPLERALLPVGGENLHVLPVGETPSNPVEILSSGLVAEFFDRMRTQFDVIIVDSSPVLGIADSPLLSQFVDAVVFVVEANQANWRNSRTAIRRLQDVQAKLAGTILTKFRSLDAGQSYSYQYRYYTYQKKT